MCGRDCKGKNLSTFHDERILLCAKIIDINQPQDDRIEATKKLLTYGTASGNVLNSLFLLTEQMKIEENASVKAALLETAKELANTETPDMCNCPLVRLEIYRKQLA